MAQLSKQNLTLLAVFLVTTIVDSLLKIIDINNWIRYGLSTFFYIAAAVFAAFILWHKHYLYATFSTKPLTPFLGKKATVAFITTVAIIGLQLAGYFIETQIFNLSKYSEATNLTLQIIAHYPFYVVVSTVCCPIIEEVIFRSILFAQLARNYPWFWCAVVASAIFAWAHNDGHYLIYWLFGMALCLSYRKSDDLRVAIVAHAFVNFAIITAAMV